MLADTTSDLEEHLEKIDNRLQMLSLQGTESSDEDAAERKQIQEELDSTKQCLTICAQAKEHIDRVPTNVFEDVSADQDAHQVIVSTLENLISAKRVTAGVGATQWLGQMPDTTLHQLSRDRRINLSGRLAMGRDAEEQSEKVAKPEDQYGARHRLD